MIDELYQENLLDSPDDIEKVIEGGEDRAHDSGPESGNEDQKGDEDKDKKNEDDKKTKVRRKLGPRMVLNADRLNGPRGLGVMESFFSDVELHGKGREREDLDAVMKRMEHWAHRLAPRLQFDDCLKKIEKLGSKKEVANRLKRIRLDLDQDDEVVRDDTAEHAPDSPPPPLDDPFDQLLASSVAAPPTTEMTAEQREQMLRNRLLAEERRAARVRKAQEMKLKFQQSIMNSQTVNSQSVNLSESAVAEDVVIDEVVDDVGRISELTTEESGVKQRTEENVSSADSEFERMLVDIDENDLVGEINSTVSRSISEVKTDAGPIHVSCTDVKQRTEENVSSADSEFEKMLVDVDENDIVGEEINTVSRSITEANTDAGPVHVNCTGVKETI